MNLSGLKSMFVKAVAFLVNILLVAGGAYAMKNSDEDKQAAKAKENTPKEQTPKVELSDVLNIQTRILSDQQEKIKQIEEAVRLAELAEAEAAEAEMELEQPDEETEDQTDAKAAIKATTPAATTAAKTSGSTDKKKGKCQQTQDEFQIFLQE